MDINNVDYIIIKFGDLLTRYTPLLPNYLFHCAPLGHTIAYNNIDNSIKTET